MNYKKILIIPFGLILGLSTLTSCNLLNNTNTDVYRPPVVENNNTANNNEVKDNVRKMQINDVKDFNNDYLIKSLANDLKVNENNVKLNSPSWTTNVKVDDKGNMSAEVKMSVTLSDGTVNNYLCVIDLTPLKQDLTLKIEGVSELSFNEGAVLTEKMICDNFLVLNGKNEEKTNVSIKIQNFANLDFSQAGNYIVMLKVVDNDTKQIATKQITIKIKGKEMVDNIVIEYVSEGLILETHNLKQGETVNYKGQTPTKTSTELTDFVFSGWKKNEISQNKIQYEAQFKEVKNRYKVTLISLENNKETVVIKNIGEVHKLEERIEMDKNNYKEYRYYETKDKSISYKNLEIKDDITLYFEIIGCSISQGNGSGVIIGPNFSTGSGSGTSQSQGGNWGSDSNLGWNEGTNQGGGWNSSTSTSSGTQK